MIPFAAPPTAVFTAGTHTVYVGVSAEPPDRPSIEFYDAASGRVGTLTRLSGDRYQTVDSPALTFRLDRPLLAVSERRFLIDDAAGKFGFSLWYAARGHARSTIVLIQGADDSTRQYGFLVPWFVAHGANVVTYDQRGTGLSTGNWRYTSPASKAQDVLAAIRTVERAPGVDPQRIGVWAASNGGWVAPIVAARYPLAFMILKSAPSESIVSNVLYEIEQDLREHNRFAPGQIDAAMAFERTMFASLASNSNWTAAAAALAEAKTQPWFPFMRIPPGMTAPPPPPMLAALQASLLYDPATTLETVRVPTLALFGALDKNVDAADSIARFRAAFAKAGMADFTVRVFPGTGHLLVASATGYTDDSASPERYTGYPEAMIAWLRARGFAGAPKAEAAARPE